MPGRARLLSKSIVVAVAVLAIAAALWWATTTPDSVAESTTPRPAIKAPTATAIATAPPKPTATPAPTATPIPTPTPVPVAFTDLIERPDLADAMTAPLQTCPLTAGTKLAGAIGLRCIDEQPRVDVYPVAPGRIVHIGREPVPPQYPTSPGVMSSRASSPGVWSWAEQFQLGPHVVVDHGPFAGSPNMQTVYSGLSSIKDTLVVGMVVDATASLGTIAGPTPEVGFSLWDTNTRQDGAVVALDAPNVPNADTQRLAASALGALLGSPTDPQCPLNLGRTQLPGADRGYRNGTHQGIDFGCGAAGRFGAAVADGTVVYLVDDYVDPNVSDRNALLHNTGLAGFTPHWTLVMLYGNVVVIDHGEFDAVGRVFSIAAHLEQVDPAITLGSHVVQGQRIGEFGNRGTNAAAQGIRGNADPSLHLHWELFIDNWYLGQGQPADVVTELIVSALCATATTPGCPPGAG